MKLLTQTVFLACALLAACGLSNAGRAEAQNYKTYKGLIMCGYQGWFGTPGDGSTLTTTYENEAWYHYRESEQFGPGVKRNSIDFWPYMEEYDNKYTPGATYKDKSGYGNATSFKMPDGSDATVYSSYDEQTVLTHFKWMKEYSIDGVFMQRFLGELSDPRHKAHFDKVLEHAFKGSDQYGRALSVMYDLSGASDTELEKIVSDAQTLMTTYQLSDPTVHPNYLHENGKPMIALWGIGFNDSNHPTASKVSSYIDKLHEQGWSVFLGLPTYWREGGGDTPVNGSKDHTDLLNLIKEKADAYFPWYVGRYDYGSFGNSTWQERIKADIQWAKDNDKVYALHVYPGGSDLNMHPNNGLDSNNGYALKEDPNNDGWRYGGKFYWNQLYADIKNGAQCIYVGMFDEMDEGTAIFKQLNYKDVPSNIYGGNDYYVTYNTNGSYSINDTQQTGSNVRWSKKASELGMNKFKGIDDEHPVDFYLQLTDLAGQMLRGEADLSPMFKYNVTTQKAYLGKTILPGTVEAEDFDKGGAGVAYKWQTDGGQSYRDDARFATSTYIGWTSNGDWCNYTVNISKAGTYKLTSTVSSGATGGGSFEMRLDGKDITGKISFGNTGGWDNYDKVETKDITLPAGEHVLTFYCYGGMNADKFVFELVDEEETTEPIAVPGIVEAEDFMDYKWQNEKTANGNAYNGISFSEQMTGVDGNSGYALGWTSNGDRADYLIDVSKAGKYSVVAHVSSGAASGGSFMLQLKQADGTYKNLLSGAYSFEATNVVNNWTTYVAKAVGDVELPAGEQTLRFLCYGGMNIDKFVFTLTETTIEAGQLSSVADANATTLKVKGKMNSNDVWFIRNSMPNLKELDLSEVEFVEDVEGQAHYYYNTHTGVVDGVEQTYEDHTESGHIGYGMFSGLTTLERIVLPEETTSIDAYAFSGCSSLTSVTFGSKVTSIGIHAFDGTALNTIDLPNTVTSIGQEAFANISGEIESLTLPSDTNYTTISYGLFQNDKIKTIKIPAQVTEIANWAFGSDIDSGVHTPNYTTTSVTFEGNSVTSIGYGAFRNLRALERIELPEGLTSVGEAVLMQCTALKSVSLPSTLATLSGHMFDGDANLETLTVNAVNAPSTDGKNAVFKDVVPNKCSVKFASGVNKSSYRANADFMALLTKTMDEGKDYDVCEQEAADVVLTRSFVEKWNTFVLPFGVTGAQLKQTLGDNAVVAAFTGVKEKDGEASLQFKGVSGMEQQTPYIVQLKDGTAGTAIANKEYRFVNVDLPAKEQVLGSNGVAEVAYGNYTFTGVYQTMSNIAADGDALYIKSNAFYLREKGKGTTGLKGFRGYFRVASGSQSRLNILVGDDATDIGVVDVTEDDGTMDVYSVSGQLVRRAARDLNGLPQGIYVVNGKKVRK